MLSTGTSVQENETMPTAQIGPSEALANLFTPDGKAEPYALYGALRSLGQIVPLGPHTTFVLGYEEIATALREPCLLVTDAEIHQRTGMIHHSSWKCFTKIMMFSNGGDHQRLRDFARETYSARHVEELRPQVVQMTAELLDRMTKRISPSAQIDLVSEFSFLLPLTVTGTLLGIPEEDRLGLRDAITVCTTAFDPISNLSELASADTGMDQLIGYISTLVFQRRSNPGNDLLSKIVSDRDTGNMLDDDELIAYLVLLLIAGSQTPSDLISNAIKVALDDHEIKSALISEPSLATAFITETLRWDPPVQALTRVAACDLDLCGTPIAAGSQLLLFIGAANRDARRFADPDRFNIRRTQNQPLAFGLGQHYCLAAAFACMEGEVAVPMFLRRFPNAVKKEPVTYRNQLVQRGIATFPVILAYS
jgi:cytochrome P450